MSLNRRGFLKTGIAGAAGIAFSPAIIPQVAQGAEGNIIYRTLGKTGMKVPVISFGVMRSDNPACAKLPMKKESSFLILQTDTRTAIMKQCSEIFSKISQRFILSCHKGKGCRNVKGRKAVSRNDC